MRALRATSSLAVVFVRVGFRRKNGSLFLATLASIVETVDQKFDVISAGFLIFQEDQIDDAVFDHWHSTTKLLGALV
jgi:hypothetical protein